MVESCGIFLFNSELELLICRATNFNNWSIPKGKRDEGETPALCAIRETFEESNVAVKESQLVYLGESVYPNKKKKLHGYVCITPIDKMYELRCNSHYEEKGRKYPEIDKFEWTINPSKIHVAQLALYNDAVKMFIYMNNNVQTSPGQSIAFGYMNTMKRIRELNNENVV